MTVSRKERPVLFDLSPAVDPSLPVWPGDTPFAVRQVATLSDDSAVNLSTITATVHLGSHADAPLHTEPDGAGIDAMPLEAYVGPCRVVEVACEELVHPEDLAAFDLSSPPRLLIKTGLRESGEFPSGFAALCPQLARLLADRGVRLVGTDAPSVDPFTSKSLEAHHALLGAGVAVLEGLRLQPVPPGLYELIALPLPLRGLDASPVRAVLRALED